MAAYRFRVTFEDYDEVYRDIEIKPSQTFEDFHYAIQEAIGFDAKHPASFFMSNDSWTKGREITLREIPEGEESSCSLMKSSRLSAFIADPHQKLLYIYDFMAVWMFQIKLMKIIVNEENQLRFPRCVRSVGEAPKQYAAAPIPKGVIDPAFVEEHIYDENEGLEGEEQDLDVEATADAIDLDLSVEEKPDLEEL